jgi:hypothetical protein
VGTLGASGSKIGRHHQPHQRNFVLLVTITTFHARCSGAGGHARSQLRVDQGYDITTGLWEQAEGRLDVTTSHNRGTLFFWLQSRPFTLAARVLEGARDRSYEWIKGPILPPDTMGVSGRNIIRPYQPQQRNFVFFVTITTFHARCSGAGGHPRSQLCVDQGYDITTGHGGDKRKEGWTLLPATTEELCSFGYNHDLSRSLLGCWRAPEIPAMSGSRVGPHHLTLWEQVEGRLDVTTSHNRGTLLFLLQSRPFTLAAPLLEVVRDHSCGWIIL